ncbi:enoyl-CoA hydratase-related protein [Spirillospora sp. NPDC048819]|uniref:enoyl-CoA hydratase-related protein n=1 Tax=Spirillospora sp. NPDC048819 TaxID=3155268 RepID=UPI0034111A32
MTHRQGSTASGEDGTLLVSRPAPGVLWLTMNRPDRRNAIDRALGEELLRVLEGAETDPEARVVVLTGAGSAFCGGDDLGAVDEHLAGDREHSPVLGHTADPVYLRIVEAIVTAPQPVIAAVNGPAAGAGTELACAADLRIASDTARIGSCLVNVAQTGTAVMLARIVGTAKATEIYLSGGLLDAADAGRLGIYTRVVPPDDLRDAALAEARRLAAGPTRAIGLYKQLRERVYGQPLEQALRIQNTFHIRNNREVHDAVEGARAFIEKRSPEFTGR